MAKPPQETAGSWRWFKCFQYDKKQDKPSETRNVLLIVTALITAVTFQAGVNPPGGVWQDNDGGHTAGRAIYATRQTPFYVFLISNTLALSSAILVIICLTYRFPFHFEVWLATISMIITYGSAVFAVTPKESVRFRYILCAAAVPVLIRLLWEAFNRWGGRILDFLRSTASSLSVLRK
ncbi:PGG domain containing protein [Trema orientale]|uniref:PGG domain containing protein n=1 Tax=Trema orientale TaxID=63057 RepID=A0A2P5FPL2_TREOI|nr:PGG domain containing protein [Trema orientale]